MTEALRPLSIGELLDRTFSLYRRNFRLFAGVALVGPIAYLLAQLLMIGPAALAGATGGAASRVISVSAGSILGVCAMMAGYALSHAATVKAVAAVHLGRPITVN